MRPSLNISGADDQIGSVDYLIANSPLVAIAVSRRSIIVSAGVGNGSVVPTDQVNLAAEKRSQNFSSPDADLAQFVQPAIS